MSDDQYDTYESLGLDSGADSAAPKEEYDTYESIQQDRARDLQAMYLSSSRDPAEYAEAIKLSKKTSIPVASVLNNRDEVKKRAEMPDFEYIAANAPKVSEKLQDGATLQVVRDDVDALANLEKFRNETKARGLPDLSGEINTGTGFRDVMRSMGKNPDDAGIIQSTANQPSSTLGNLKAIGTQFSESMTQWKLGHYKQLSDAAESLGIAIGDAGENAAYAEQMQREYEASTVRSSAAQPDFSNTLLPKTNEFVFGGASSLAQTMPVIGAGLVNPALGLGLAYDQTSSLAYSKYRQRGGTKLDSVTGAIIEGGIEVVTEKSPIGFAAKNLGKMEVKEFAKQFLGREMIGEQAATFFQDLTDTLVANPDKTMEQFWKERPEAFVQTMFAVGITSGAMAGVQYAANKGINGIVDKIDARDLARKDAVKSQHNSLLGEVQKVEAMQATHLDKDTVANVLDSIDGEDKRNLYVDPSQLLNQEGLSRQQLDTLMPSAAGQIDQALQVGGLVQVPRNELITNLAATKDLDNESITRHFKEDPTSDSKYEMEMAGIDDQIKQADILIAKSADSEKLKTQRGEVYQQALQDLNESGMFKGGNDKRASIWAAMATATAMRTGMAPMDLYKEAFGRVTDEAAIGDAFNQYAGQKAQGADLTALQRAKQAVNSGADAEQTRQETGWFRGPDNQWRHEIDDSKAVFKGGPSAEDAILRAAKAGESGKPVMLPDVLRHESLFAAYPELKNIEIQFTDKGDQSSGAYSPENNVIAIRGDLSAQEAKSTLLHEIQHAIQRHEGFAVGGSYKDFTDKQEFGANVEKLSAEISRVMEENPDAAQAYRSRNQVQMEARNADGKYVWTDALIAKLEAAEKVLKSTEAGKQLYELDLERSYDKNTVTYSTAFDQYKRLHGEIEARDTQARADMSAEERKASKPYISQGIPDDQVIVRLGGSGVQRSEADKPKRFTTRLVQALREIGSDKKSFKYKTSKHKEFEKVLADMQLSGFTVERDMRHPHTPIIGVSIGDKKPAIIVKRKGKEYAVIYDVESKKPHMEIGVSDYKEKGIGGSSLYMAVAVWAKNNGKVMAYDPERLTAINFFRRTEMAISDNMRHLDSDFIPDPMQFAAQLNESDRLFLETGGAQDRPRLEKIKNNLEEIKQDFWDFKDWHGLSKEEIEDIRLNNLAIASASLAFKRVPQLLDMRLGDDGQIYDNTGNRITRETYPSKVGGVDAIQRSGVGFVSAQRALLTRHALSGDNINGMGELEQLFDQHLIDRNLQGATGGDLGNGAGLAAVQAMRGDSRFYQTKKNQATPRGTYDPSTRNINLTHNADLSTFLHESGHMFLDIMVDMSLTENASESLKKDMDVTMQWFGIEGDTPGMRLYNWSGMSINEKRQYHEKWAESFEQYLFEGKAPSMELAHVFSSFRQWLLHVYKSIAQFVSSHDGAKLNDEVRGVFDRMLATEEQIQEAEAARGMLPLFDKKPDNMTDAEWKVMQQAAEDSARSAFDQMTARSLRDMKWLSNAKNKTLRKLQHEADAQRREARMEARQQILSQPVYRAWQFLKAPVEGAAAANRKAKASKDIDSSRDSLLTAIAKLGGLNMEQAVSQYGLDSKDFHHKGGMFGMPVLRKNGGMSPDAMGEALSQYGYLPLDEYGKWDILDLEDKLREEAAGRPHYSTNADYDVLLGDTQYAETPDADQVDFIGGRLSRQAIREMYDDASLAEMQGVQVDTEGKLLQPAYHGTPYKFDKFSLEHMGKGEGAQAYGWGLYFAGSKDVAEYYRKALSGLLKTGNAELDTQLAANGGNLDAAIIDLRERAEKSPESRRSLWSDALLVAENIKASGGIKGKSGQLYKVEIPEDDTYLLWDKPLSEQSDAVKSALQPAIDQASKSFPALRGNNGATGQGIYEALKSHRGGNAETASKFLHENGINGIKYLDGTSRNQNYVQKEAAVRVAEKRIAKLTKEGKSDLAAEWERKLEAAKKELDSIKYNYVIFDDNAVQILETYYQKGGKDKGGNKLEQFLSDEGLHPDTVADLFGLSSGDELVRKLLTMPDPVAEIERLTDEIMLQRHADLATPEARERAAEAAIHNEAHVKFLATELTALNRAIGKPRLVMAAAREYAAQIVSGSLIKDLNTGKYEAAEVKAGRAAEQAFRSGNKNEAALQKRNQVLHAMTVKMVNDAKDEMEKHLSYLKKFDKFNKKIDPDYQEQIDTLLERYDLRKKSLKAIQRSQNLGQWIEQQKAMGLEPVIPDKLLDESQRTNYKLLTVDEMRGLVDAVKNIEHLGRLKNRLLTDKAKRELNALADAVGKSITDNGGAVKPVKIERNSTMDRLSDLASGFFSMHRKLASIVRQLDGWKDGGLLWETMIRPMNEAGDNEAVMHEKSTLALAEVFAPLKGKKLTKKMYIPMIANSLSYEGRLAVALNWGNEGNRQRLMDGDNWGVPEVGAILATLTADDWKFVQGVWDHIATYKDAIGEQQKRLTGIEPSWVDATPFEIKSFDGQMVQVRGGYYPAKYDTTRSTQALSNEAAGNVFDQWKAAKGQGKTRDGFTKSRATQVIDRPIRKDFGVITQHITEVTHRLAWQDWVVDMNRLLKKEQVDSSIRAHYGNEILEEMRKAIEDITTGDMTAQSSFEKAINHLRIGTTIVGLGYNLTTSLLQPFGLTQSMVRIGPKWVAKGLSTWIGNPARMNERTEWVYGKSDFMRLRGKTMMREMNEILNAVRKEKLSKLEASYFYGIQKMQVIADMPTWLGQYEKSMAEFDGDEIKAIALADQAVLDAQGGGQNKDLSRIQRGGPLLKLWTNFYSFFNTTYNLTREVAGRTDVKDPASVAKAAVDMLLLYSIPAVMGSILKGVIAGDDDDDELADRILRDQMSYLFGTMVGLREISAAFSGFSGYQGPAGTRFFSEVAKFGKQAEQGEADAAFLKSLNNIGGIIFHYPAGQVNRTIEGANALMDGETDNMSALIFGKPK